MFDIWVGFWVGVLATAIIFNIRKDIATIDLLDHRPSNQAVEASLAMDKRMAKKIISYMQQGNFVEARKRGQYFIEQGKQAPLTINECQEIINECSG